MKKQLFQLMAMTLLMAIGFSCETHETTEPGNLVPLTVDEDSSLPAIDVNNTRLHSETYGDPADPMLVVLHGGPGGDYRSLLNCQAFASDGFYVVFYDQRGSGLSRRHNADVYSIQVFIDDLDAVIEHYRSGPDQKIILMGHSWGAMLATAYVNEYPERISGLVLMEPGGLTWETTLEYIERSRSLNLMSETTNDFLYLDQFLTGSDHEILDYKFNLGMASDFSKDNKVGNAGPYPFWRNGAVCNQACIEYAEKNSFDFTTNLSKFTAKVLFMYSELNISYGREHAELVSSAFPEVDLVKIDGTGHEIPYFGWDNFYPVAKEFLNTIQ